MKLSVGIINSAPHWDELLNQIGVSVHKTEADEQLLNNYPVIIIGDSKEVPKYIINKYLIEGGSVIAGTSAAKYFFNIPYKTKNIDYIYSQPDDVFNFPVYADIRHSIQIPAGSNYIKCNDDSFVLQIKYIEKGTLVIVPDKFLKLIFSVKSRRKLFYTRYGRDLPTERAAMIDKQSIYNIFYRILEYLFHKKNLPFTRLWQIPEGKNTIFGFRIDTDLANDYDINNLYKILEKNKIKGTWFIETKSRENNLSIFNNFSGQEIALHCYRHKIYNKPESNLKDIEQGLRILKNSGFSPSGYAAPFGDWNKALGESINKSQFLYSSEFGYAYDSLPAHSLINNSVSKSLQLPIHPVSVGRLNIAGHNNDDMIKYYTDIMNQKINSYDPVFFYTHPSQKRLDVFDTIFKMTNDLNIPSYTFNDFAQWWKKRETINWKPEILDNKILFNTETKSDSFWIHTSYKDGTNYLFNTKDVSAGKEIKSRKADHLPGFKPDIFNKYSIKLFKQELIYNYRKLKY